jgi:Domain of unknown function (DUF6745)
MMDKCVRALYDTQPQIRAGAVREIYEHGDCTHVKPLLEAYANSRDGRARYDIDAFGQQDAGSLSFYDDFRTVFGALAADRLAGFTQISKCTGWWRPYLRLAILTERPSGLSRDSRGRRELTCAWSACCRLAPFSLAADASD